MLPSEAFCQTMALWDGWKYTGRGSSCDRCAAPATEIADFSPDPPVLLNLCRECLDWLNSNVALAEFSLSRTAFREAYWAARAASEARHRARSAERSEGHP